MRGTLKKKRKESGYVMLGAIVLMAIGALVIASNLDLTASSASMTRASRERSDEFMTAEQTLGFTSSWLRSYSTSFTTIFGRSQFYSKFDRTAPTIGANDSGLFAMPTRVKLQGTDNSVILSKGAGLPSSVYPNTIDTITNLNFNPSSAFANGNFGSDLVRVTLVDAVAVDSSLDFGDPDDGNALPSTDFNPIYRIDAMKSTDRGGHVFGYLAGSLVFDHGIGFFGKESIYMNEPCDSYLSNSGAYGGANRRANCTIGSEGQVCITNSSTLYGSVRTKGNFKNDGNCKGKVCADFTAGCPKKGQICQGSVCSVPPMPTYYPWETYCPGVVRDQVISGVNVPITVASNAVADKCWRLFKISGVHDSAVLKTTNYSYFFKTLDIPNNGLGLTLNPNPAGATINVYTMKITGDKFNANQMINTNNKPYQLRLHYLGTDALKVNGNADLSLFIVAPYADVTVSGNAGYYGGIKAKSLSFTGNGSIHYDESGDITTLSDVQYKVRDVVGRYR